MKDNYQEDSLCSFLNCSSNIEYVVFILTGISNIVETQRQSREQRTQSQVTGSSDNSNNNNRQMHQQVKYYNPNKNKKEQQAKLYKKDVKNAGIMHEAKTA